MNTLVEVLLIILSGVVTLCSGIILAKMKRNEDKAEKREQQRQAVEAQREKDRQEREDLTLQSIDALFHVTKELVECTLKGKQPNGELQEAYEHKQDVKHRLEDYARKQVAKY